MPHQPLSIDTPYNIWLISEYPFQKLLQVQIAISRNHPILGMLFSKTSHRDRINLADIEKGTPAAKTPRWRSTLKCATLLKINGHSIKNTGDVREVVQNLRLQGTSTATWTFTMVQYHGLHPTEGSLMLYYDQLNVIAKYLLAAQHQPTMTFHVRHTKTADPPPPAPNKSSPSQTHHQLTDDALPSEWGQSFTL